MFKKLRNLEAGETSDVRVMTDGERIRWEQMLIAMIEPSLTEEVWTIDAKVEVQFSIKVKPTEAVKTWKIEVPVVGKPEDVTVGIVKMTKGVLPGTLRPLNPGELENPEEPKGESK